MNNTVESTVKEKVERIRKKVEKKMPFSKFECKDVGIPTYKRDKRENHEFEITFHRSGN